MEIDSLPILGVCGVSGSGKTTLIEQSIPGLLQRGLKVAVAKQTPKRVTVDQAGKDSSRFFAAGADCLLLGEDGVFSRRQYSAGIELNTELVSLAREHDLVLVEGYRHTRIPRIWLLGEDESEPVGLDKTLAVLPRGEGRQRVMETFLDDYLTRLWLSPMVLGCVLIGGKSSRMGTPKHLLVKEGRTWLERTTLALAEVCDQVVVVGEGELGRCRLPRLLDAPGVFGPLAGLLAVMRWHPWATVLACACDLPDLSHEALQWLLDQRTPGAWAVIPQVGSYYEPLLALYDFRIRSTMEAMASRDERRLGNLVGGAGVRVVSPPQHLRSAWRNVNYPE